MKNHTPKVTIIIPLYVITERFFQDFLKFDTLNYKNIEVLVVCDKNVILPNLKFVKTKLILTNQKSTGPAEKRDIALQIAKGKFCAFIDDDAYPHEDWLKIAIRWFRNPDIVAVGGPGVTPPEDSYWEKISGHVIESYLCSGDIQDRFYVGNKKGFATKPKFVVDWPAYNLIVRTNILKKINGYGSKFYGGEDTLLCLKLMKYGRIVCDPEVLVYHHRRRFPRELLKQIGGVGLHRGYFFKKYPETSRSLVYLLPSLLGIGLVFSVTLLIFSPGVFLVPFLLIFGLFFVLAFISIKKHNVETVTALISAIGIILVHLSYGAYFIKGFLTRKLKR